MRVYTCWQCGQLVTDDSRDDERHLLVECRGLCPSCRDSLYGKGEQHKPERLFKPAPPQMPGQLGLGLD